MDWFKGNFYRKTPYFMEKMMFSCRFSLHPIHCFFFRSGPASKTPSSTATYRGAWPWAKLSSRGCLLYPFYHWDVNTSLQFMASSETDHIRQIISDHRPYLCGVGFRNMKDSAENHSCFNMVPINVDTYCRKPCYPFLSMLKLLSYPMPTLCYSLYYTIVENVGKSWEIIPNFSSLCHPEECALIGPSLSSPDMTR